MDQAVVSQGYVYSRLAGDPDLGEIVDLFVEEMPERVATLLDQLQAQDWEGLRRTAHQLKGAAGSYGFDMISPCAGRSNRPSATASPNNGSAPPWKSWSTSAIGLAAACRSRGRSSRSVTNSA